VAATDPKGPAPARLDSKDDILSQFAELVADRGYELTSIGDVASAVGLSKGTVMHHFGAKLALLEKVHHDFMQRRLMEGHAIIEQLSDPAEQLSAVIYCLLLIYREDRAAALAFTREITRYAADPAMTEVRKMRREYYGLVRGIVTSGMETGQFRAEDATIITLQIFGMCNWAWTWLNTDGPRDIEDIAATFTRTILGGLGRDESASQMTRRRQTRVERIVQDLMRDSRHASFD
jgi:AcrR family transcriptional regulator